jgi:hypothetical protein
MLVKRAAARANALGCTGLMRLEGEMKAMVAPGLSRGGVRGAGILKAQAKVCG